MEFTPHGHVANVNNSTNAASYITYRRATELNPCNEFVVMDLAVVISSKGEAPPHTFIKVSKTRDDNTPLYFTVSKWVFRCQMTFTLTAKCLLPKSIIYQLFPHEALAPSCRSFNSFLLDYAFKIHF